MTIGNVTIAGKAALAPMAGVADRAFRKLCVEKWSAARACASVMPKARSY